MNSHPEFGALLNQYLTEQDRTPAWLARRLGMNGGTISRWLNDGMRPGSPETVIRIADVLGMTALRDQLLLAAGYGYQARSEDAATQPAPDAQFLGRGTLPQALTPFIGRREEIARLTARLRDEDCRLLTLVGPGGIGKTRLAVEVARRVQAHDAASPAFFADGCFFTALLEVESPQQIDFVLAGALGLMLVGQQPARGQLLAYLHNKQLLLLLDNFDHLLESAELVTQILTHAPQVKVLVTSRVALGVPGEWFHPLDGLAVPEEVPEEVEVDAATLATYDAVRLFQQCAQRASPAFDLKVQARPVQQICRLVEGLPLAIELAAAWLRLLPCARIAQELGENLVALASPLPNAPPPHRSLQAVLSRSWQMLTPHEAAVLEVLALFPGGFDEEAALDVAQTDLMTLAVLVQKSMIRPKHEAIPSAPTRYSMHETLRHFAREQAQQRPGAVKDGQARHSRYYLQLLQRQTTDLLSERQPLAMASLDTEFDNVRAAWQWATVQQDYQSLALCMAAFYQFCTIRSYVPECLMLFEQITAQLRAEVARDPTSPHRHLLGRVLMNLGSLYADLPDAERAIPLLEESLAYVDETLEPYARAWVWGRMGYASNLRGKLPEAEQWFVESLASAPDCDSIVLYVLQRLSHLEETRGNYAQSCALGRKSLTIARALGRSNRIADVLNDLAGSELRLGEYEQATSHLQEALAIWRTLGNRHGEAQALHGLGKVACFAKGNHAEARAHMDAALALYQAIGHDAGYRACLADLKLLDGERVPNA